MTDREIIVLLAEKVMGWVTTDGYTGPGTEGMVKILGENKEGWSIGLFWWPGCLSQHGRVWNPLESIADAYEVGLNLPREDRAFLHRFMKALDHIACVDQGRLTGGEQFYLEVHATPRQRCMAIIEALQSK